MQRQIITFIALLILLFGLSGYYFFKFLKTPLALIQTQKIIRIPKGVSVREVLTVLEREQVLSRYAAKGLLLWIKLTREEKHLKAGTYLLFPPLTPEGLLHKLVSGDVAQFEIRVLEGETYLDFRAKLKANPYVQQTLQDICDELYLVHALNSPYPYLEGLFFPDTYYFLDQTTDVMILKLAYHTMQRRLAEAWQSRDPNVVLKNPYEALILASIIEKESAVDEERPIISGVFQRRLAQKMRLQADPTVLYGLGDYKRDLKKEDLKTSTPYNTYLIPALPPTPITLPGLKSIQAALHPDSSKALYFVSKGDGTHFFSDDLKTHQKAVEKYQLKVQTPMVQPTGKAHEQ